MSKYVLVYQEANGTVTINNLGSASAPLVAAVNPDANGHVGLPVDSIIPMPADGANFTLPPGKHIAIKVYGDVQFAVTTAHTDVQN